MISEVANLWDRPVPELIDGVCADSLSCRPPHVLSIRSQGSDGKGGRKS
jgi:hypothetical protein